ncbi:transcriptional regulator [Butyrivibrio sp. AE2005]|uniref:transcriptional regulator n=1 Tax=Butyrivibrio sp. AE2005 TaxID=1496722 RepID=UPI00047E545F|nr:transcriptional regulator [Butyrivibrio sp. AE2005]
MEINSIPEAFHSKLRLAILSSLLTGQKSFSELKDITSATDGNLGAQIKKMADSGFVMVEKEFVKNKPQTTCIITEYGRAQLIEYVEMLENIIKQ